MSPSCLIIEAGHGQSITLQCICLMPSDTGLLQLADFPFACVKRSKPYRISQTNFKKGQKIQHAYKFSMV